jgi:hypothetical protein
VSIALRNLLEFEELQIPRCARDDNEIEDHNEIAFFDKLSDLVLIAPVAHLFLQEGNLL